MPKRSPPRERFYGTTTMSEKGQVVIPAPARAAMGLKKGDKLLVIGLQHNLLALTTLSGLEQFVTQLTGRLESVRRSARSAKGE